MLLFIIYPSAIHRAQEGRVLSKYTLIIIPGHFVYAQKVLKKYTPIMIPEHLIYEQKLLQLFLLVACFTHWWQENWASIKNTELQNKKPRLRYNPLKNIVLLGCCWSVSLQFNLSLGKNAKIVSGNITLKNIASIYIDRKHVWEGKKSSCPRNL